MNVYVVGLGFDAFSHTIPATTAAAVAAAQGGMSESIYSSPIRITARMDK